MAKISVGGGGGQAKVAPATQLSKSALRATRTLAQTRLQRSPQSYFHSDPLGAIVGAAERMGRAKEQADRQFAGEVGHLMVHPKLIARGIGKGAKGFVKSGVHQQQVESAGGGFNPLPALGQVAAATVQHPGKVLGATVKSLPGAAAGIVTGPAYFLNHPAAAIKGMERATAQRWGANAGKTVQQEGLLPIGFEVAAGLGPAGRIAGFAAKEGAFGARAAKLMEEGKPLRQGPQRVVPQPRHPNIIKAGMQATREGARVKAQGLRAKGVLPKRGIEAQPGEVVPVFKRSEKSQLLRSGAIHSNVTRNTYTQAMQAMKQVMQKEVPKVLTKEQRNHGALRYAQDYGITTPEHAKTFLPILRERIIQHRADLAAEGKPQNRIINDELPHIDWLIKHPEAFNEPLRSISAKVRELGNTAGENSPRITPEQMAERRATPQAWLLGAEPRAGGVLNPVTEGKVRTIPARKEEVFNRVASEKAVGRRQTKLDLEAQKNLQQSELSAGAEAEKFQRMRGRVQSMIGQREGRLKELEHLPDTNANWSEAARLEDEIFRLHDDLTNLQGAEAWAKTKREIRDVGAVKAAPKLQLPNRPAVVEHPARQITGRGVEAESIADFQKRVATARTEAQAEHGHTTPLAEPGYFKHTPYLKQSFADYALGKAAFGAMRGPHHTEYNLMRRGAAVVHPQALEQELARTIKTQSQVSTAANVAKNFAVDHVTDQTTGERLALTGTRREVETKLEQAGVRDLVPYHPNTVFAEDFPGSAHNLASQPEELHNQRGWVAIPKAIHDQMQKSVQGGGLARRLLIANKGIASNALLGWHPSWPAFRIAHNTLTSMLFGQNIPRAVFDARKLDPEVRQSIRAWSGADPLATEHRGVKFGAAAPEGSFQALLRVAHSDTRVGQAVRAANPAAWVRTIARPAMFAERHNMAFFRYHAAVLKLNKTARAKIADDTSGFMQTMAQAQGDISRDPQAMETITRHVDHVYGDFANYPGIFKPLSENIMFFGYLRYATRVLLKTLPVEHPILSNILLNLGKQNQVNTRKLLGLGPNESIPLWLEANVYSRDKSGNLSHQNFFRMNPLGAGTLEQAETPLHLALSGLPFAQSEAFQQLSSGDILRQRGLRVEGKAEQKKPLGSISLEDRLRIAANDFGNLFAPHRVAENILAQGQPQGNDTLLWNLRPIIHKGTEAIANDLEAQNFAKKQGAWGAIIKSELPFLSQPSRDDVLQAIAKQQAGKTLTPKEKARLQRIVQSQPGYAQAFRQAQVLSAQRSKRRRATVFNTPATPGNAIDNIVGSGGNAIDAILGP